MLHSVYVLLLVSIGIYYICVICVYLLYIMMLTVHQPVVATLTL